MKEKVICCKCGQKHDWNVEKTYKPPGDHAVNGILTTFNQEILLRKCHVCEYEWAENTLDESEN